MTTYRKPREPFIPGTLRTKTWRSLEPNISETDKRWGERCGQYWTLQARLYGVVFSPYVMLVDNREGFVSTYATVLGIIPGKRTEDWSLVTIEAAEVDSVE